MNGPAMSGAATGALAGLRVLDFSWVWSGPMVAASLGDLGADVIKVEHGKRLDNSRLRGRPTLKQGVAEGPSIELNPYFHQTNHGKRSITLNLKDPRALELIHALVRQSDILVENLTVGALARQGLGYAALAEVNPRLIYLSMSAVGQTGPLRDMRAYAPIMSSFTGLESLIGYPGEAPVGMLNFGYGDPNAGAHALVALLAALWSREQSGQGQHIDMAQIEAILSVIPEPLIDQLWNGKDASPQGNRRQGMVPHGNFPALSMADGTEGWVAISVRDDDDWQRLCRAMGNPDWAAVPALAGLAGREARQAEIEARLGAWTATLPRDTLVAQLQAAGIPAAPVLSIEEQMEHPQFAARGLMRQVNHPHFGAERLYVLPWQMSATPPSLQQSAPLLGADNDYVFGELLKLPKADIETLKAEGVIA